MPSKSFPETADYSFEEHFLVSIPGFSQHRYIANTNTFESNVSYGENISDWRQRLRLGQNATTSASGKKIKVQVEPGSVSVSYTDVPSNTSFSNQALGHAGFIDANAGPSFSSGLYDSALSQFVSKARAVQSQFQAGVFLGELRETIGLFRRPYKVFRSLTKQYHSRAKRLKRQRLSKRDFTRGLGDAWLTYAFGVKPLLHDIDDAARELARLTVGKPPSEPVKVYKQDKYLLSAIPGTIGTPIAYSTIVPRIYQSTRIEESVTIRGAVQCLIPNVEHTSSKDLQRVVLSEFIPTVWELIPYSFLVDYFTNIGDMISAVTFLSSTVSWCNATRRATLLESFYYDNWTHNVGGYRIDNFQTERTGANYSHMKWDRQIVTSFIPSLHFTIPGMGSKKWLNMTALLATCRRV